MANSPIQLTPEEMVSELEDIFVDDDKEDFGYSQLPSEQRTPSPILIMTQKNTGGHSDSPKESNGSRVSWKEEKAPATYTGNSSSPLREKCPFGSSSKCLGKVCTQNSHDRMQQRTMFGKKKPASPPKLASKLVRKSQNEISNMIGTMSGSSLFKEILKEYRPISIFAITDPFSQLPSTIYDQFQVGEKLLFSGVKLELVSRMMHGRSHQMLILKLHMKNGGMPIKASRMLSSMNFAEEYQSAVHLHGSTSMLAWYRPKEAIGRLTLGELSLLRTWIQEIGMRTLTSLPGTH